MEKAIICKTLELTGYDKERTCKKLGISQTTLWRRLKSGILQIEIYFNLKEFTPICLNIYIQEKEAVLYIQPLFVLKKKCNVIIV